MLPYVCSSEELHVHVVDREGILSPDLRSMFKQKWSFLKVAHSVENGKKLKI